MSHLRRSACWGCHCCRQVLRTAKVRQPDMALVIKQEVLGLQVPMHNLHTRTMAATWHEHSQILRSRYQNFSASCQTCTDTMHLLLAKVLQHQDNLSRIEACLFHCKGAFLLDLLIELACSQAATWCARSC